MRQGFALGWIVALALMPGTAQAATFTVDSLGDASDAAPGTNGCVAVGGGCTLRAAIEESNALGGTDRIEFLVTGTLFPASPYTISSNVTVDGTMAPGYRVSSPAIAFQATGAVDACIDVTSGSATIRALQILGGCTRGIRGGPAAGLTVAGNVIGLRPPGSSVQPVSTGIEVASVNAVIGGAPAADRNVVSGATGPGIAITGNGVSVRNNLVGTNAAGDAAAPNGTGILVNASFVNIGQAAVAGSGNVISGNLGDGIHVASGTAFIQRNRIGLSADGTAALGNGGDGVEGAPGVQAAVGGGGSAGGNEIVGSGAYGVRTYAGNVEGSIFGANRAGTLVAPNASGRFGTRDGNRLVLKLR